MEQEEEEEQEEVEEEGNLKVINYEKIKGWLYTKISNCIV